MTYADLIVALVRRYGPDLNTAVSLPIVIWDAEGGVWVLRLLPATPGWDGASDADHRG